eukprot:CAMPEP_0172438260 /NCGR_PEP_ID=MMETSP1064-20121228/72704_1 /TAXON_ID=202472 /ORGANISM="Aulacoseira subarctica , Strain CCAP 1002/5" /LENGTH=557 /DNA_ID=CAMNT_0013186805 /DNA_START=161 /DNA_END=1835 /DNA_ORIENTATION=-
MKRVLGIAKNQLSDLSAEDPEDNVDTCNWRYTLTFSFKSRDPNVYIEGVTLVSANMLDVTDQVVNTNCIQFEVEIVIRATAANTNNNTSLEAVTSTLEIAAVLLSEQKDKINSQIRTTDAAYNSVSLGLLAMEIGGGIARPPPLPGIDDTCSEDASSFLSTKGRKDVQHYGVSSTFTKSAIWKMRLVTPLTVKTTSIGGARAALGATLVSLEISHSNDHSFPVIVKSIAFYSGHSRLYRVDDEKKLNKKLTPMQEIDPMAATAAAAARRSFTATSTPRTGETLQLNASVGGDSSLTMTSMLGGSNAVLDMTRHVRWAYAQGTAPTLPITLYPHETVSTVVQIDAGEDLRSRTFVSPVAITAVVVENNGQHSTTSVIAADATWTTERVAVVPADALRVDLSLRESRYKVGAPLVISIRVLNLSNEDRNLMLLMAKDESSNSNETSSYGAPLRTNKPGNRGYSVNTAVVSEVNGYTFGVWGLSGDDDGTTRQNRDHELLAVDAALLLGDVKGQHSIEAELRFVPLREGTLDVPNLKLYDKAHGKWYNCIHCLKIVAAAS